MYYQPFRRVELTTKAEEIEQAIQNVDEHLYVDGDITKPGVLQIWRKHPESHLPMHITDIPPLASVDAILRILKMMDTGGENIFEKALLEAMRRRQSEERTRRSNNEQ